MSRLELGHRLLEHTLQIKARVIRGIAGKQLVAQGTEAVDIVSGRGRLAEELRRHADAYAVFSAAALQAEWALPELGAAEVPGIERLAAEQIQVKLALSLHAPNDRLRTELMPVTKRYPLARLMAACRSYRAATRRRIFVEYLMLDGVNDADGLAVELADLLGREGFHVNLIAYNPTGSPYRASPPDRVAAFAALLESRGVSASYRRSHGQDIDAACGQLAVRGAAELRRRRSQARRSVAGTRAAAPR